MTPTGLFNEHMVTLRTMLSECTTVQDWLGAADAEEALENIIYYEIDEDEGPIPPRLIVVYPSSEWTRTIQTMDAQAYSTSPGLVVHFVADTFGTISQSLIGISNTAGAVFAELEQRAAANEGDKPMEYSVFPGDPMREPATASTQRVCMRIPVTMEPT